MTSELNNNSDLFPAFVAKHNVPDIHSDIVRSERELGEWYANYDGCHSWFEDGTLYVRNFHGQESVLCKADSENEAYLEMAKRARKDEANVIIETEDSLLYWAEEVAQWTAMLEKLREVKNS